MPDTISDPVEEAHIRATEDVYGDEARIGDRWLETIRQTATKEPLACLAVAFVLGVVVARRR